MNYTPFDAEEWLEEGPREEEVEAVARPVIRAVLDALRLVMSGGPGSGHRGHRGIPGHRGGSLPDEGPKEEEEKPPRTRAPKPAKVEPTKPVAPPEPTGTRPKPASAPVLSRNGLAQAYDKRIVSRMAADYARGRYKGAVNSWAEYLALGIAKVGGQYANLFDRYIVPQIRDAYSQRMGVDPTPEQLQAEVANFMDKAAQSPYDAYAEKQEAAAAQAGYQSLETRPISDLAAVPEGERWDNVRHGFEMVDQVLAMPDLTSRLAQPTTDLKLPIVETRAGTRLGVYYPQGTEVRQMSFNLQDADKHEAITVAHETGHAIDHLVFGIGSKEGTELYTWLTRADPDHSEEALADVIVSHGGMASIAHEQAADLMPFVEVMDTLKETDTYQDLRAYHAQDITITRPDGREAQIRYSTKFMSEARSNIEVFARGFEQYIATKSGDPEMRAEITTLQARVQQGRPPMVWPDDEFAPIVSAFDRLFESRGMLK
jgi:hypothetical protein